MSPKKSTSSRNSASRNYKTMSDALYPLIAIGLVFGALGALTAYLITYKEWAHHYLDNKQPKKMALEAAAVAFVFFLAVAILVGIVVK